jgi:hypothetical protein
VNLKISTFLYTAVVFLAAAFIFYGDAFEIWKTQLMGIGPDGVKNYYTLAYHIAHDQSSWWFSGMNYPTGEHLLFTDNQPLIANILRWLNAFLPIEQNLIWLLPIILFGSYLLGAILLSNLILKTGTKPWFAALSSAGIMLLSPQLVRLSGHYSLAYGFIIPLLFVLVFRAWQSHAAKSWIPVLILLYLVGFIHPYFTAMASLFVFLFRIVAQISERQLKSLKAWANTFWIAFGGMLLFQMTLSLTDPITDRPASPYGFLVYRATLSSIFMPVAQWYMNPIKGALPFLYKTAAEGNFYIGFFAFAGSIWALYSAFINNIKNWYKQLSDIRKFALFTLIASFPIMLLSIGFPFVIGPLEKLLDYSGPLQQFRGIGRFSFVFYYAANLFAAVEIGHYFMKDISKKSMSVVMLFFGILWYEAYSYKTHIIDYTTHGSKVMSEPFFAESNLNAADFQAIIPLPYFHTGSENFRTSDKQENIAKSFALSQESGLPLTSVHMSRTSLSQTLRSLEWNYLLLDKPQILSELQDKPYLLFVDQHVGLEGYQTQLIYHSKSLFKKNGFELRSISTKDFEAIVAENITKAKIWSADAIEINGDSMRVENLLYYQSFDSVATELYFKVKGAATANRTDWTKLVPLNFKLKDSTVYELSFWFEASSQNTVNTQVWHSDYIDGEEVNFQLSEIGDHTRAVLGNWILVVIPIEDFGKNQTVNITLHRDGKNMLITYDEILLKPALLHTTKKGSLNINNRYYKSVSSL